MYKKIRRDTPFPSSVFFKCPPTKNCLFREKYILSSVKNLAKAVEVKV